MRTQVMMLATVGGRVTQPTECYRQIRGRSHRNDMINTCLKGKPHKAQQTMNAKSLTCTYQCGLSAASLSLARVMCSSAANLPHKILHQQAETPSPSHCRQQARHTFSRTADDRPGAHSLVLLGTGQTEQSNKTFKFQCSYVICRRPRFLTVIYTRCQGRLEA